MLQEDLTTEINLPVMTYLRKLHFRERIWGDEGVTWSLVGSLKNVNDYLLLLGNDHTKQVKVTHIAETPQLWKLWNIL